MCETIKLKRSAQPSRDSNSGFTLVELLLVIAIIAVLATMSLGVLRNAQDDAKAAATQARILQIESLLAIQLEDYEVRRLPMSTRQLAGFVLANRATDQDGNSIRTFVQLQALRRQILMDVINSEIPRPIFNPDANPASYEFNPDVGVFPSTQSTFDAAGDETTPFRQWLDANYPEPAVNNGPLLSQRLEALKSSVAQSFFNRFNGDSEADADETFDLPGEYLYALLQLIDIDGVPAVELVGNPAIGNSDGDSHLELIDAWGEPLQLRIWQVDVQETDDLPDGVDPGSYVDGDAVIYRDVTNINFDLVVGGFPTGYVPLNPVIPRGVDKIRFQVVSPRIARQQGDTSDAVAGP